MSDQVEVDVPVDSGAQEPAYASDDYDVFVSDAPVADEATNKLLGELKAKQEELTRMQSSVDPVNAMRDGIAALGDRIAPRAMPDVRVQHQQIDFKAMEEEFNKTVYDNPFQKTAQLFQAFQAASAPMQANANLAYAKRIVQVDPATRDMYQRFASEVEEDVARATPQERATNPAIYDEALTRVKAKHMEELFAERLATEMKKSTPAAAAPQPRATYAEGGSVRPAAVAPPATKRISISQSKMSEVEAFAEQKMIPVNAALSYYERHGLLR
jgi:Skp family chaperone for outer membrane proteins